MKYGYVHEQFTVDATQKMKYSKFVMNESISAIVTFNDQQNNLIKDLKV